MRRLSKRCSPANTSCVIRRTVPTDKGLAAYRDCQGQEDCRCRNDGMWETALSKIEAGNMDADTFREGIEVYAAQITAELLSVQLSVAGSETCPCPNAITGASSSTRKWRSVPTWTVRLPYSATSATTTDRQADCRPGDEAKDRANQGFQGQETARLSMLRWCWTNSSMSPFHFPKRKGNRRNSLSLPLKFHCDRFCHL